MNAIVGATTGMVIAGAITITGAKIITIMMAAIANSISIITSIMIKTTGRIDATMTIAVVAIMAMMINSKRSA
ncbi:hypothetical protein D3C87_2119030 [compost metagenome]